MHSYAIGSQFQTNISLSLSQGNSPHLSHSISFFPDTQNVHTNVTLTKRSYNFVISEREKPSAKFFLDPCKLAGIRIFRCVRQARISTRGSVCPLVPTYVTPPGRSRFLALFSRGIDLKPNTL